MSPPAEAPSPGADPAASFAVAAAPFVARPIWHEQVDSTMDEARALAVRGAPAGTAVLAHSQRRGRGRNNRAWASARGDGIYLTCILRPQALGELPSLSPALALALTALGPYTKSAPLQVKWPNDLLGQRGKVGGLLLEQAADEGGRPFVLVGLGLNLKTPVLAPAEAGAAPPLPPSGLLAEGAHPEAVANLEALGLYALELIGRAADDWQREGFAARCQAYDRAHAWQGKQVLAEGGGQKGENLVGQVDGIEPDGALRLLCGGQTVLLRSATLRLQPAHGPMPARA